MTPLIHGLFFDRLDFVRSLLKKPGIDLNHQDIFGRTALMNAAMLGNIGGLEMLLTEQKVDVNLKCNAGNTVLDYARACENPEALSVIKASARFKELEKHEWD